MRRAGGGTARAFYLSTGLQKFPANIAGRGVAPATLGTLKRRDGVVKHRPAFCRKGRRTAHGKAWTCSHPLLRCTRGHMAPPLEVMFSAGNCPCMTPMKLAVTDWVLKERLQALPMPPMMGPQSRPLLYDALGHQQNARNLSGGQLGEMVQQPADFHLRGHRLPCASKLVGSPLAVGTQSITGNTAPAGLDNSFR